MGWYEEIFVLREGIPIAYLDYKGSIMVSKLRYHPTIDYGIEDWAVLINSSEFKNILSELDKPTDDYAEKYIVNYFKSFELLLSDQVFITGS